MVLTIVCKRLDTGGTLDTFTFSIYPTEIKRASAAEWKVRFLGKTFFPRGTWWKRITDQLTLTGRLPWNEADGLRKFFTYPASQSDTFDVAYYIEGASDYGIAPQERWVPIQTVEIASDRLFKRVESSYMPYATYRVALQKVGEG